MATKKSLYEILGVPRDANAIDIGIAYERLTGELSRAVPPQPGAQSLLHEAHEVLSHPKRRAAYDASLVTAAGKAEVAQQAEPDLVIEADEEKPRRSYVKPGIAAGAILLIAVFFMLRPSHVADTAPQPVVQAPTPAPAPPPKPLAPEQILRAALLSTGRVMSYEMSGRAVPVGLAIALEPAVMVTTCHGISGGTQLVVKVGDESNSGNLTVTDEALDLCRISVPGLNARAVSLASDEPRAGDAIYVLGANAKGDLALTEGRVNQVRATPHARVLELSVPIAPAGSGGAVFDSFGHVVAIATTAHSFGAKLNIAIPASSIAQMRSRERDAK